MARAKTEEAVSQYSYLTPDGSLTKLASQQLKNPFDPGAITWKPTNVKSNKCIALAYADKRTYEERLDMVFGPENWGVEFRHVVSTPYHIIKKAKHKDWKDPNSEIIEPEQVIDGNRVMVVVRIAVRGLEPKESSGVSESEDENSITTAEAQAFKRACSMLGVGKYLYFLPRYEGCSYAYGKITDPPQLPDWAIPVIYCEDCTNAIRTTQFKAKDDTVQSWNPIEIVKRSQQHFSKNLCMDCMRVRREKKTSPETDARLKKPNGSEAPVAEAQAA
jgi:hypothetical protein